MAADQQRTIVVVDDDPKIVHLVRTYLERDGYRVVEAADGASALRAIDEQQPDLVVLDLMLPVIDGLSVLDTVRRTGGTPVIILSARGTVSDRIEGLSVGADDYLPKPFSPSELALRVRRVLERADGPRARQEPVLVCNGLSVDRSRHAADVDGRPVALSATELRLLVAILDADGRVLTRNQLLDAVYGTDSSAILDRTIDVLVGRLRVKLGDPAEAPRFIATVRGAGYRACAPAVATSVRRAP